MKLFKPVYSTEDITQQVSNIERLHKLRDMVFQKLMLAGNDGNTEAVKHWDAEYARYTRNIESGQRYLDYMQEKVTGK